MRIALFQPDIPQNTGTVMRMAACFGVAVDLIEPAGFNTSERAFRRAALDYLDHVMLVRHASFDSFEEWRKEQGMRLVLLTTTANQFHHQAGYRSDDIFLLGRESAGVPQRVHRAADLRVRIPMRPDLRSINVAVSAAVVVSEAMRQTGLFDGDLS